MKSKEENTHTKLLIREKGILYVKESIDKIRYFQYHHSYEIMIPLTCNGNNIWLNKNDIILMEECIYESTETNASE